MDIYRYVRLSHSEKQQLLEKQGEVLEVNLEDEKMTKVYHLMGFFVEVTFENGEAVEHIPYQRGFKVNKSQPAYECAA